MLGTRTPSAALQTIESAAGSEIGPISRLAQLPGLRRIEFSVCLSRCCWPTGVARHTSVSEGCQTHISQRRGWPEHCVWNPFTIKTLLELAGLRMGAPSAGPCLSGAWVSGTPRNHFRGGDRNESPRTAAFRESKRSIVEMPTSPVDFRFGSGIGTESLRELRCQMWCRPRGASDGKCCPILLARARGGNSSGGDTRARP